MADQKYKSKSFVISFISHQGDSSSNAPYVYKVIDDKNFEASILFSLLKDGLSSEVDSEKEIAQKAPLFQSPYDNNEGFWFKVRIVVHSHKDFSIGQVSTADDVASFAQDFFLDSETEKKDDYLPMIHITLDDSYVGSLFSINEKLPKQISRSFQILDSSIWNKIVPYVKNEKYNVGGLKGLYDAIAEIDEFYQRGLYNLQVTHEYANLNARLAKQAFLSGAHASGVSPFIFHSESAIQWMIKKEFAGEYKIIKDKIIIGEDCALKQIVEQKWRILLVDDKAIKSMSNNKDESDDYAWSCKLVIIFNLILNLFELYAPEKQIACKEYKDGKVVFYTLDKRGVNFIKEDTIQDDCVIVFEYAQSVDDAKKILKKRSFDLVLLDYYLEKDKKGEQSYGTNLLEDIYTYASTQKLIEELDNIYDEEKKNKEINRIFAPSPSLTKYEEVRKYVNEEEHYNLLELFEKKDNSFIDKLKNQIKSETKLGAGPNGRQFFMFISAYSSAVYERLLAEGLNQSEKFWFISVGACPTNTPQLFLYNLIKMMEKRLEDSGILKLSSDEIYKLVNRIYLPKKDSKGDSVRKRANALYQKVLSLQYHYRNILKDVEIPFGQDANDFDTKGSVLMTNFIKNKINLGGMLEHLTQLVHLTAFGTIRQWPEMWEEYIYFKAMFEKQLDNVNPKNFNDLCHNIENYILELKSQQQ